MWQTVIVSLQYLDDGRKEHHVVLGASLDTGCAWDDDVSIVAFGTGEVGGHEVGV